MENFVFYPNTKLAAVYYNRRKPPHLFRIRADVTLSGLNGQMDQINLQLNYRDTWRVVGVEYQRPSTDSAKSVRLSQMKTTTCSRSLVSTVLEGQSSWTLRWSDLLNKFKKSLIRP